jgi:hypothetical protein
MSIEVELPDGTIVEFPDGASSGFISTILKRNSVQGQPLFRSIGGVQARQQEINPVDSNKPSMDGFLNFMSGGFTPDIQEGNRLSNIGQYAAEDLSQLSGLALGGVANFANNANLNRNNSVMDTALAGAELIPSGALAGQAARLAGKGASRFFSEALDQSLRSPMSNQAGMIGVKPDLMDNAGMKLSQTEKQDWLNQVQAQHPTQYDSGVKKARKKGKHKTVDGLYQNVKNNMLTMQKANTPIKKTKVWAPIPSNFDLDSMGFKQTHSSNSRSDGGFDSGNTSSFSNYWTHPSGATVRFSDHAPVNARAAGHDVLIHPNSHANNEDALKSIDDAISNRMKNK